MASEKITAMIDEIKALSVLELKELVDEICETFGVSAVAAAAPAAGGAAAAADAKTEFDVVLTSFGDAKMGVIKVAKEVVESAPKAIKEGVSEAEANEIKEKFEAAGATIEIK